MTFFRFGERAGTDRGDEGMATKNTSKVKKLGELLVDVGLITDVQLREAVAVHRTRGGKLGDVLVDLKFLGREVLLSFLGKRCGVSYVALSEYGAIPEDVIALVPATVARRQTVLPLKRRDHELTVAMADPLDIFATDDLKILTGCEIKVVIAAEADVKAAIESCYGGVCEVPSVEGQVRFEAPSAEEESGEDQAVNGLGRNGEGAAEGAGRRAEGAAEGASRRAEGAANLLNVLLDNAARAGAAAVHMEPGESSIRVRYRVKDRLVSRPEISGKFQEGLAVRVKELARMNPLETWAPQEGHIRAKVSGRELDIRVSTLPTFYGEKIVLRFVDNGAADLELEKLGFDSAGLSRYRKALEAPGGLVLITGPAGAGKSATFYASLLHLSGEDRHAATMEDPVDRCLPGLIQVQARPHVGLTVASGVRSLLGHDADVIGVGEIRQDDEARAVMEAVQAGVPVVATLRAPSAARALARLVEAGLPPEFLATALKAVVAQKWVPGLCPDCRESYNLPRQTLLDMGFPEEAIKALAPSGSVPLFRSKGCGNCGRTGLRGRVLLLAVSVVDDDFRNELKKGPLGRSPAGAAFKEAALRKAAEGAVSLDEALR